MSLGPIRIMKIAFEPQDVYVENWRESQDGFGQRPALGVLVVCQAFQT